LQSFKQQESLRQLSLVVLHDWLRPIASVIAAPLEDMPTTRTHPVA